MAENHLSAHAVFFYDDQNNSGQYNQHADYLIGCHKFVQNKVAQYAGYQRHAGHYQHGYSRTVSYKGLKEQQVAYYKADKSGYRQPDPGVRRSIGGKGHSPEKGSVDADENDCYKQTYYVYRIRANLFARFFESNRGYGPTKRCCKSSYFPYMIH